MAEHPSPAVHVEVVLRAGGDPADAEARAGAVTAATIADVVPAADVVDEVRGWFRAHGFDIGPSGPLSFTASGAVETFAEVFDLDDAVRDALVAPPTTGSGPVELSTAALPPPVRRAVTAVVRPAPPAFGPGAP